MLNSTSPIILTLKIFSPCFKKDVSDVTVEKLEKLPVLPKPLIGEIIELFHSN